MVFSYLPLFKDVMIGMYAGTDRHGRAASQEEHEAVSHNGAVMLVGYGKASDMDRIVDVMQHQNTITEILLKQQSLLSLSPLSLPMFKGDPLEYRFFIHLNMVLRTELKSARTGCIFGAVWGQPRALVNAANI